MPFLMCHYTIFFPTRCNYLLWLHTDPPITLPKIAYVEDCLKNIFLSEPLFPHHFQMQSETLSGGSSNSVAMAWWPFCAFRHETSSCCSSPIHSPVCPKLHMFDKSPGLKTSTCQYSLIVIAPPNGNRKWHVLHSDALFLHGLPHPPQMWWEKPEEVENASVWRLWDFIQWRSPGGAVNFDVLPLNKKLL